MICPNCHNIISVEQTHCDNCGSDMLIVIKLFKLSNYYYNEGLERAKIRDLSGAALMLRKSLKVYKLNTDSRNLLGLILYEMGETVAALSEWVISKHFKSEDNDAEHYMNMVQANPAKLETRNQAIKKYNIALEAAKQGNGDLAVIQLKKVISLNPNFLRAAHLLSLLYIKNGELDRAYRLLNKIQKIDIANTTTLRYLAEIKHYLQEDTKDEPVPEPKGAGIMPITRYREEKPNVLAWVNWFLGMAIGIALTFILIVPTIKSNIKAEYNKEDLNYAAELNILNANITSNQKEIESLRLQIQEKEDEIVRIKETDHDPDLYDPYFSLLRDYQAYLSGVSEKSDEELYLLAKEFAALSETAESSQEALQLYEDAAGRLYPLAAEYSLEQGISLYEGGSYDEAYNMLLDSYIFDPDRDNLIYYLGQACQMLEQYVTASAYYNQLIDEYPDSALVKEARDRLDEMGMR